MREKLQAYVLAAIFLVLLYNSPSGLVFYWILNNLFSLAKNIVSKTRKSGRILYWAFTSLLLLLCVYVIFFKPNAGLMFKCGLPMIGLLSVIFPLAVKKIDFYHACSRFRIDEDFRDTKSFILAALALFFLVGLYVPLSVISASPAEFSFNAELPSLCSLVGDSAFLSLGFFVFWPLMVYAMFSDKVKNVMNFIFHGVLYAFIADFFLFHKDYGIISQLLIYADSGKIGCRAFEGLMNFVAVVLIFTAVLFMFKARFMKKAWISMMNLVCIIAFFAGTVSYAGNIRAVFGRDVSNRKRVQSESAEKSIHLSRDGKNVLVFHLDRATSAYIWDFFDEDPSLKDKFSGFTLYPNTVAFSYGTLAGAPPAYGGYEYVPAMMNLDSDRSIPEKYEEAVSVLPRIFAENGYSCLMTRLPYIEEFSALFGKDYFFMDKYENIETRLLLANSFESWKRDNMFDVDSSQLPLCRKRLFPYSIFRCAPNFARRRIYDHGKFYQIDDVSEESFDPINILLAEYLDLDCLPDATDISSASPCFAYIRNNITHTPYVLQYPDYVPKKNVTQRSPSKYASDLHWYVNMAGFKLLGKYFDFLKENDVYDNTRIIICADHGNQPLKEEYAALPRGEFAPVLLVKDFSENGDFKTSHEFMTNADVPSLAVKDIIKNPINPATGRNLTEFNLKNFSTSISTDWRFTNFQGNEFVINEGDCYTVIDDIFKAENWKKVSLDEFYGRTKSYRDSFDEKNKGR